VGPNGRLLNQALLRTAHNTAPPLSAVLLVLKTEEDL
jgi:hypothetical protein